MRDDNKKPDAAGPKGISDAAMKGAASAKTPKPAKDSRVDAVSKKREPVMKKKR